MDINAINPESGTSAIMLAAALGYRNMCGILLDANADLHAKDHSGNTPLHLAAQGYGEQMPVIEALLQRGADANAINDDGFTPAVLARRMENDACYRLLESRTDKVVAPPSYQEADSVALDQEKEVPFSFT